MEVPGHATQPGCEASSPPLHPTSTHAEARSAAPGITAPWHYNHLLAVPCLSCSNSPHNASLWCNKGVYPHRCISVIAARLAASSMGWFLGMAHIASSPTWHATKAAGQREWVYCKCFELAASSLPSGDPQGKCPLSLAASTSSRSCCHACCRLFLEHQGWLTEIPPSTQTLRLCSSAAGSTAGVRNSPEKGWENPIAADRAWRAPQALQAQSWAQ